MRAISKNTRKATAITLAAALVIAVYLNWQYARTGVTLEEDAVNVSAVSQETVPVTDELMTEAEAVSSANKNYGEAQLVSVANNSGSDIGISCSKLLFGLDHVRAFLQQLTGNSRHDCRNVQFI